MSENQIDKLSREVRVFTGGAIEGAAREAWTKSTHDTCGLASDIAHNFLIGAGTGAMIALTPEVVPTLAVVALGAFTLENINPHDQATKARNAKLANVFSRTWSGDSEETCRRDAAKELGKPVFDLALAVGVGGFGFRGGSKLVENELAATFRSGSQLPRMGVSPEVRLKLEKAAKGLD